MDSGIWFLIILGLVIFNFLFSTGLDYINHLNWKDLIPNELKDFYKPEKYKKAREYSIKRNKISQISSLFGFTFIIGLLCFNGYGYINDFVSNYSSSYKTTKKTFFLDIIKSLILTLIIGSILLFPSIYLFETLESGFWIWLWIGVSALMIFINMFYADLIVPLFNKLTPLENGDLRKKIEVNFKDEMLDKFSEMKLLIVKAGLSIKSL